MRLPPKGGLKDLQRESVRPQLGPEVGKRGMKLTFLEVGRRLDDVRNARDGLEELGELVVGMRSKWLLWQCREI